MFSKLKSLFKSDKGNTFIGIIDELGASTSIQKDSCTVAFNFCAYINNEGEVIEEEIRVFKDFPDKNKRIKGLNSLSIVKIKGEKTTYYERDLIKLFSVIETDSENNELDKILQERLKPVIFKSTYFGDFILDRGLNWFETKTKWLDNEISISLSVETVEASEIEKYAIELFENQESWHTKFINKITSDLLELKNECWLSDNEEPLNATEFKQKIAIDSITFYEDGDFDVWFKDGGTFWGHHISIFGNLNGELGEADING
jgi:hypothetical protein